MSRNAIVIDKETVRVVLRMFFSSGKDVSIAYQYPTDMWKKIVTEKGKDRAEEIVITNAISDLRVTSGHSVARDINNDLVYFDFNKVDYVCGNVYACLKPKEEE